MFSKDTPRGNAGPFYKEFLTRARNSESMQGNEMTREEESFAIPGKSVLIICPRPFQVAILFKTLRLLYSRKVLITFKWQPNQRSKQVYFLHENETRFLSKRKIYKSVPEGRKFTYQASLQNPYFPFFISLKKLEKHINVQDHQITYIFVGVLIMNMIA